MFGWAGNGRDQGPIPVDQPGVGRIPAHARIGVRLSPGEILSRLTPVFFPCNRPGNIQLLWWRGKNPLEGVQRSGGTTRGGAAAAGMAWRGAAQPGRSGNNTHSPWVAVFSGGHLLPDWAKLSLGTPIAMVRRPIRNQQLNIGDTWLLPHSIDAPPSAGFQSCQRQDFHSTHHLCQRADLGRLHHAARRLPCRIRPKGPAKKLPTEKGRSSPNRLGADRWVTAGLCGSPAEA
uniref:Uncharacterized protein n=2 Tax=Oryza rufipogon TaxID=4529 RepID=A0A0E0PB78_ORYRU